VNLSEFKRRRRAIMGMMGKGSIAILPAAPVRMRNRDVEHAYRQDSDFHYLTGFNEPQSIAVLVPGRSEGEFLLFCRDSDPARERWDGKRAAPSGAVADFGADEAHVIDSIDDVLPGIIGQCESVYYTMGAQPEFDTRLVGWINDLRGQGGQHTPDEFIALDHLLHDLRLFKSRAEISAMKKAARITVAAHRRAISASRPGMHEYELEAEYIHEFRRNGVEAAYQPIVGGGANGCILHYVSNDQPLQDGDLVLADVGAEYECYAADVTRTWPVNGRFSTEQRALYDIVLAAHDAAIKQVGCLAVFLFNRLRRDRHGGFISAGQQDLTFVRVNIQTLQVRVKELDESKAANRLGATLLAFLLSHLLFHCFFGWLAPDLIAASQLRAVFGRWIDHRSCCFHGIGGGLW